MPDADTSQSAVDRSLDEVVAVLGGAAIIVHDFEGVISRWTAGCERLYGWTHAEAVGRVVYDLLATDFPEPIGAIQYQVKASGFWQGELTHRHKDGHLIYVASRWTGVEQDGFTGSAIIEMNNDISDLRAVQHNLLEREALVQSILDTTPESIVVID